MPNMQAYIKLHEYRLGIDPFQDEVTRKTTVPGGTAMAKQAD